MISVVYLRTGAERRPNLVDTAKLEVTAEVLLVQGLQAGVEESAEKRALDLFHHFRACLLIVVFGHDRAELVVVEVVLLGQLVGRPLHEAELLGRDAQRVEHGKQDFLVVLRSMRYELQGSLQVIQERVDI